MCGRSRAPAELSSQFFRSKSPSIPTAASFHRQSWLPTGNRGQIFLVPESFRPNPPHKPHGYSNRASQRASLWTLFAMPLVAPDLVCPPDIEPANSELRLLNDPRSSTDAPLTSVAR